MTNRFDYFFKLNITNYKHNQVWNKSPEKFSYQEFHFLLSNISDSFLRNGESWFGYVPAPRDDDYNRPKFNSA